MAAVGGGRMTGTHLHCRSGPPAHQRAGGGGGHVEAGGIWLGRDEGAARGGGVRKQGVCQAHRLRVCQRLAGGRGRGSLGGGGGGVAEAKHQAEGNGSARDKHDGHQQATQQQAPAALLLLRGLGLHVLDHLAVVGLVGRGEMPARHAPPLIWRQPPLGQAGDLQESALWRLFGGPKSLPMRLVRKSMELAGPRGAAGGGQEGQRLRGATAASANRRSLRRRRTASIISMAASMSRLQCAVVACAGLHWCLSENTQDAGRRLRGGAQWSAGAVAGCCGGNLTPPLASARVDQLNRLEQAEDFGFWPVLSSPAQTPSWRCNSPLDPIPAPPLRLFCHHWCRLGVRQGCGSTCRLGQPDQRLYSGKPLDSPTLNLSCSCWGSTRRPPAVLSLQS